MFILKISAMVVGLQFIAAPFLAQTAATKDNAHTSRAGPKTDVPHSMKKAKTSPTTPALKADEGAQQPVGKPDTSGCCSDTPAKAGESGCGCKSAKV
jgi:hypothetical protein